MNYTERNKLLDKISVIGLMAILVEVFLYAIDCCFKGEISDWLFLLKMPMILNIAGSIFLVISIILYVWAYRKASSNKVVYATEFLVLAFLCPFLTYWYMRPGEPLNKINPKTLWVVVLVYYICRVIYTCVKAYLTSNHQQLKKKKN